MQKIIRYIAIDYNPGDLLICKKKFSVEKHT